jgi:hypothetical protein
MRPVVVIFIAAFLPFSARSQSDVPALAPNGVATTVASPPPGTLSGDDSASSATVTSTTSGDNSATSGARAQQSKSPSQQQPKHSKPKPPSDQDRPPGEASMVGYIDDAIVSSQVRFRFDAGFDNNRPDRAEFFYAACGCNGSPAAGPAPGVVLHLNFQQLYMRGEYAPVRRFSVFAEVPIRWIQPQQFVANTGSFGNHSGLSDVQVGFKFAAVASRERYLTFQFSAEFPSGDSSKGLGTAHYSIQPSLLYFQKVTDRLSFEGQLGGTHSFQGDYPGFQGDVLNYGLGPSFTLYKGEQLRIAPVVELVGWRVFGGLQTNADLLFAPSGPKVSADGTNIVNLKAGIRTSMGSHNSFYAGFGQALTHEMWYKHVVRLEYRYTF